MGEPVQVLDDPVFQLPDPIAGNSDLTADHLHGPPTRAAESEEKTERKATVGPELIQGAFNRLYPRPIVGRSGTVRPSRGPDSHRSRTPDVRTAPSSRSASPATVTQTTVCRSRSSSAGA